MSSALKFLLFGIIVAGLTYYFTAMNIKNSEKVIMSFRFERKALFHFSDYIKIKKLIFDKGGSILFPKRFIKSLYFDNYDKQSFID